VQQEPDRYPDSGGQSKSPFSELEQNAPHFQASVQPGEYSPESVPSSNEPNQGEAISVPSLNPAQVEAQRPFYQRNPLTVAFSVLLTVVYALTTFPTNFQGPPDLIVMLGGFYPPAVHAGEWWRFITATLLHGNPGHLFNNVAGLLIFGNLLESVLGSRRLMGLYVFSTLAGMGLSYYTLPQGMTFGASAIDYGLIGAYLTLVLILRYRHDRAAFFSEFRGALLFVLLFVGWNMLESATVNLWAHIGGLLAGVIFALWMVFVPKRRRTISE
jgi:rhomboid protease GluP